MEYRRATVFPGGKIPSTSSPVENTGYLVVVIPADRIGPRSEAIRGSSHVTKAADVSVRSGSTGTAVSGNRFSAAVPNALEVTAVVQVSSNEDDVLEIYAEELDHETVELIDGF